MTHFHLLKVASVNKITPKAIVITFGIPNELSEAFTFIPGQYITIKKEIDGKELRRSYSICSAKKDKGISVGIKEMPSGTFSKFAQSIQVGDTFEVHPPEGRFTFQPENQKGENLAAFVAGSGITPIMSIAKEALKNTNKNFLLVYGNKSLEETMFHKDLTDLLKEYPNRFSAQFVYSQAEEEGALFGRIEKSTINFILKNKHKETPFDAFYICGPEAMIETVKATLEDNNISEDKIHIEHFTTSDDHSAPETVEEGKTKVKVLIDDEETEIIMDRKQRVLDAVLDRDLDAPYSCQGGICSSCVARLTEGKVEMVKNQILTDSEIAEGLILTCQAHPTTDTIAIDYDDV
ncbi:ferredoxin--NADP reductase [Galbibacter mesophilus]|uniref:ferredoxin--NADP reductase n=1 Tax=Galbibacter mesophilus TaxID=379069 RepID=UPI00191EAF36|nr:ferredoxin--NADP reductase [Galbibacter mesophilus]MCM5662379.1 ferredoxin--NADP reductase [Galbibacter mesophilus]